MADNRAEANSLAVITKRITGISRSAARLNQSIHETAVLCLEHIKTFGDAQNTVAALVDAMPMSHRRSLLVNWFEMFSPVGLGKNAKDGKMKGFLRGKKDERDALWNIPGAKATPFYAIPQAAREPDMPTFESINSNIVSFLSRMLKKAEKIEDEEGKQKALEEIKKLQDLTEVPAPEDVDAEKKAA